MQPPSDTETALCMSWCGVCQAVALVHQQTLVVSFFDSTYTTVVRQFEWQASDKEMLRSVCWFVGRFQVELAPVPLLAVSGDSKSLYLFVPSVGGTPFSTVLHAKKIQTMIPLVDNSLLIADKFGDVYVQTVAKHGGDTIQWASSSPKFVLQHLSTFTALQLVPAVGESAARLITCDRDAHVRVSRYPDSFLIDNYLWAPSPQSPVTAVACAQEPDCSSFVMLGSGDGRVCIWRLHPTNKQANRPDVDAASPLEELVLVHENPGLGSVVGAVFLTTEATSGFVVAFETSPALSLYPIPALRKRAPGSSIPTAVITCQLQKQSRPLLMEDTKTQPLQSSNQALLLQRDGTLSWVSLGIGARNSAEVFVTPVNTESELVGVVSKWKDTLDKVDVNTVWRSNMSDPRTRRANREEEDEDEDDTAEAAGQQARKRGRQASPTIAEAC